MINVLIITECYYPTVDILIEIFRFVLSSSRKLKTENSPICSCIHPTTKFKTD